MYPNCTFPTYIPMFNQYTQPLYYPLLFVPIATLPQYTVQTQENSEAKIEPQQPCKITNAEQTVITSSPPPEETYESEASSLSIKKPSPKLTTKRIIRPQNSTNLFKESTNYQKNFAKALVIYAQKQVDFIMKQLGKRSQPFFSLLQQMKNKIRNLSHVTQYTDDPAFLMIFRKLGYKFLKTECVAYIYNSKIQQKTNHLKRRAIIMKALSKI